MKRVYQFFLSFYPARYRASFGPEMLTTFDQTAEHSRQQGRVSVLRFMVRELAGLVLALPSEWIAWSAAPAAYITADSMPQQEQGLAEEIPRAQRRVKELISRMEFAIAHHDFPNARRYSYEEREARQELDLG